MKNEYSRGLRRLYKGRNFVPKFQDNLTMKKTPQHAKNTEKHESNALKRPTHNRRRETPQSDILKRLAYACRRKAPQSPRHMRLAHDLRRYAPCDLREKSLFKTFSPLEAHDFSPS